MVLQVNILIFVFSCPEKGQKGGQIGEKSGYAEYNSNLHKSFFYFSPNCYTIWMCIPQTSLIRLTNFSCYKNGAKMDSFSYFSKNITYLPRSKCNNKFRTTPKPWKASLTHFLTKSVPKWSNHTVYTRLNSIHHI